MAMKLVLEIDGTTYPVSVSADEEHYTVTFEDETFEVDVSRDPASDILSLILGHRSVEAWTVSTRQNGDTRYHVTVLGETFDVDVEDALRAKLKTLDVGVGAGGEIIRSPMPGVVVQIEVEEGQVVEAGQPVIIVEAMKMRNEFGTKGPGRVSRILVQPGQSVERGSVLIEIAPLDTK
jgi:biotin carboxyl carrier protein